MKCLLPDVKLGPKRPMFSPSLSGSKTVMATDTEHNHFHFQLHVELTLEQSTILQVVLDDDVCDCIKDELNIVSVCGTGKMSIDLFLVFALI